MCLAAFLLAVLQIWCHFGPLSSVETCKNWMKLMKSDRSSAPRHAAPVESPASIHEACVSSSTSVGVEPEHVACILGGSRMNCLKQTPACLYVKLCKTMMQSIAFLVYRPTSCRARKQRQPIKFKPGHGAPNQGSWRQQELDPVSKHWKHLQKFHWSSHCWSKFLVHYAYLYSVSAYQS